MCLCVRVYVYVPIPDAIPPWSLSSHVHISTHMLAMSVSDLKRTKDQVKELQADALRMNDEWQIALGELDRRATFAEQVLSMSSCTCLQAVTSIYMHACMHTYIHTLEH